MVGDGGVLLLTGVRIPYYNLPNIDIERRGVSHGIRLKHWRAVGARVQRVRHRKLRRPDGGRRQHGPDPVPVRAAWPHAEGAAMLRAGREDVRLERAARPDGRALGISISERSGSLGRGRGRDLARQDTARSRSTRCGSRSTAASSSRPAPPRRTSRARSSTASRACCTSASPSRTAKCEQTNFHDYNLMRMSDLPEEMHVHLLDEHRAADRAWRSRQPVPGRSHRQRLLQTDRQADRHLPFTPERVSETLTS